MLALAGVFVVFLAADPRLIRFYDLVWAAERRSELGFAQALANAMAQEPCSLFRQAKEPTDLQRAHAFLARHHQMRSGKPLVQRNVAALVQRADRDGERLAAGVALVQAGARGLAVHQRCLIDGAAFRA